MKTAKLRRLEFPNPYPEMQPGGSFMNLTLAADWVQGQLDVDGLPESERIELREAYYRLILQMRRQVANLTELPLRPSAEWLELVGQMTEGLGRGTGGDGSVASADEDGVDGGEF
jgi:hypothetical protein